MNASAYRSEHLFPKDQERAVADGRDLSMGDPMDGLRAQPGSVSHSRPMTTLSQKPVAEGVEFVHEDILDFKVREYKTQKPDDTTYPSPMDDIRKNVAAALNELIGEGKRFTNRPEVARRAQTLGLVERADSFAKTLERVMKGNHDSQISTLETIATAVGVSVFDLLIGNNFSGVNTDPEHANIPHQSSLESVRLDRARIAGEDLLKASAEMRETVDKLLDLDRRGGADREMALAGVGYILQGIPKPPASRAKS